MSTMQALLLTRPSPIHTPILSLETLPVPSLSANHILISIHASAIHPSDLLNVSGAFPMTQYPVTPGRDFSGTVTAPATHALYHKRVFGTSGNTQGFTAPGSHAECIAVREDAVVEMPSGMGWIQAATIGVPFSTAALILSKAGLGTNFKTESGKQKTVFVLGANGSVGSAVSQLALARGARVWTGTRNENGDVNTSSDPTLSALASLTGGMGVDIIIDTVGSPSLTSSASKHLSRGGKLVFISAAAAATAGKTSEASGAPKLEIDMLDFYRKEHELVGVNSLMYGVVEMAALLRELVGGFEEGELRGEEEGRWTEVPFGDAIGGFEKARERGRKVVLVIR